MPKIAERMTEKSSGQSQKIPLAGSFLGYTLELDRLPMAR